MLDLHNSRKMRIHILLLQYKRGLLLIRMIHIILIIS
nr:MAG TPA: hypothetical protein [Caudoviricetes sp.]